jgi:hypothetical protein
MTTSPFILSLIITSLLATAVMLASARTPKTHERQLNEKNTFLM